MMTGYHGRLWCYAHRVAPDSPISTRDEYLFQCCDRPGCSFDVMVGLLGHHHILYTGQRSSESPVSVSTFDRPA